MAINLHEKYAKQISEKFAKESVIVGVLSNEYDWACLLYTSRCV